MQIEHKSDGSMAFHGHVQNQFVLNPDGTTSGATVPDVRTAGEKVHATIGTVRAMSRTMLFARDIHHGDRASLIRVSKGMATPNDGDMIPATTHPEVVKGILRGDQATCSDTEWLNDPYKRGMWSRGTAYLDDQGKPQGWVRMPDLNQAKEGSLPPPFARGGADTKVGSIGKDQMRNLVGRVHLVGSGIQLERSGVFGGASAGSASQTHASGNGDPAVALTFDASKSLPEGHTGTEFAPWHIYGVSYSITSNGVFNEGAIDAEQVMGEVQLLKANIGYTYIYPNGGSAQNPAFVAKNQRYEMSNPFPAMQIECRAEILVNGEWGDPNFGDHTATGGTRVSAGVRATPYGDKIEVQTGLNAITHHSEHQGDPFGGATNLDTAKCRVLVYLIGSQR